MVYDTIMDNIFPVAPPLCDVTKQWVEMQTGSCKMQTGSFKYKRKLFTIFVIANYNF